MQKAPFSPPKPVAEIWRPELVRLPCLTPARRAFRAFARGLLRLIRAVCLRAEVRGLENFPKQGPALVVINHRGDADTPMLLTCLPVELEALGRIELYDFPILGKLMDWYGIIWLHRGRPDRRAMRAALDGLAGGRFLVIAPEGRYSLVSGLEEGGEGAAFLARKADVPIIPVALTGTDNIHVYASLRRLKRARVTLTVGSPFCLGEQAKGPGRLKEDTRRIMQALADLLPPELRGVYA
jgi:1-acyl-sn-glycerol-3-phosphate acyltransferase